MPREEGQESSANKPTQSRRPDPKALVNHTKAVIAQKKLERYCLNPNNVSRTFGGSSGSDKARVFKAALGFDQSNWEMLKERILEELPYHEALLGAEDEFGSRYNVKLPILGVNGKTQIVLTAWIVRPGTDVPDFVTAWCTRDNQ
jgi:uncharacterized protein DUF6883